MLTASKIVIASLCAILLITSVSRTSRVGIASNVLTLQSCNREVAAERKGEVEKTARLVIETIFRSRQTKEAFEQYFQFSPLSPEEKSTLEKLGYDPSDETSRYKDVKTGSRVIAANWNYEYQPVLLVLGTTNLTSGAKFKEAFDRAQSIIETERKRALAKRGLSEEQYHSLLDLKAAKDNDTLERNLTMLEQLDADLNRFIEQKTDQVTLKGNIAKMEESLVIEKHALGSRTLYEVQFKPMFKMVLLQQDTALKMVAFGDVL